MRTSVVPKGKRTTSRFAVWIWLAAPLALVSCVRTFEYPAGWARPEVGHSDQACPMIAGAYKDYAKLGPGAYFVGRYSVRGSLIYNLLSKEDHPWRRRAPIARDVQHLIDRATHVEIVQPAPDILQVIIWSGEGNDQSRLWLEVLSMAKGDFSCGPDGLRLRSRTDWLFVGIINFFAWESRTFNRSEDGSLLMKIGDRSFGNLVFVPLGLVFDYWIRWTPIPSRANPEDAAMCSIGRLSREE